MATSFSGRENRRVKVANIIMKDYADDWFTVHNLMWEFDKRWKKTLTEKEFSKLLPIFESKLPDRSYLESEHRAGYNYKFYHLVKVYDRYGEVCPLYVRRDREP